MSARRRPPGIPEPGATIPSILATLRAIKESLEVAAADRGDQLDAAVTREDLIALGLVTEADLGKIARRRLQTG